MRARHLIGVAVLTLAGLFGVACVHWSGATFTGATRSDARAATAHVHDWLHVYSQSTDPDGLTGYAPREGSSPLVPAATGQDESIAVHLGGYSKTNNISIARVVTIASVSPFPESGVGAITATASLVADPDTGDQPITAIGFAAVGGNGRTNPMDLTAGQKLQLNLRVRMRNLTWGTLYQPRVRVLVTWTGFTAAYFRYEFVVKVYYGDGPGPD